MPLTLAVAGLTSSEKTALIAAIKANHTQLSTAWTLIWEPADFPENPNGLLYCPRRDEGRRWAEKMRRSSSCLLLAALLPLESSPSEVPLFVRMPFSPQEIVDALNLAARRIMAIMPEDPASDAKGREERVDIQVSIRGASRVDPLVMTLFALFHVADKSKFYKIRQSQPMIGKPMIEIWCWPDLDLYWSNVPEEHLLSMGDIPFEVYHCHGKREALSAKSAQLRRSGPLLWRAGTRAFKTAELLPWIPADAKLALMRWPDLPIEARSIPLIKILTRLTKGDATFSELLTELKIARKDLSSVVNGLILSSDLAKSTEPRPFAPPSADALDPEQALFIRAVALRCSEIMEKAIEQRIQNQHEA